MTSHHPTFSANELLRSAYRPFPALQDLLEALTRALAERTQALEVALWLHGVGSLRVDRRGREVVVAWAPDRAPRPSEDDPRRARDPRAESSGAVVIPLLYGATCVGEITLVRRRDPTRDQAEAALFSELARSFALLVKRYEVQQWLEERFGPSIPLVGTSSALRAVEIGIETTASADLPVQIRGEFGTEKVQVAAAIHCGGPGRDAPFVEIRCAAQTRTDPAASPLLWLQRAGGGTLFLNGIDELHPRLQSQLLQHQRSRVGQWIGAAGGPPIRIIASTTADLRRMVHEGRFSKALLAELDFLSIDLPPLRARADDIAPLVTSVLERHGHDAEEKRSEALIAACEAYGWPENLFELERVIARLAVMTGRRAIGRADVLEHAPWMAADEAATVSAPQRPGRAAPTPTNAERWARSLIARDLSDIKRLHEGVQRALCYIADHYLDPISLGQLARQAGVSASHLSFLFKGALGTTFKPFLGRVRVEKAKEILSTDNQARITDVAMDVGFTDLSHFEKLFRRIVGTTPRDYRRRIMTGGDQAL